METLTEKNLRKLLVSLQQYLDQGADLPQLIRDLVNDLRRVLLWKISPDVVDAYDDEKEWLKSMSSRFQTEELYRILRILADLRNELRYAPHPQMAAEFAFMRIVHLEWEPSLEGLKKRIEVLESSRAAMPAAAHGMPPQTMAPPKPAAAPAPMPRPAAQAQAPAALDDVQNRWPELIEKLRNERHRLFPAIQESRPVKLEGQTLTLSFPNLILKNSFEQKKEEARAILNDLFQVQFHLMGEVQPVDHDAFVQEAEKLFEGTLVAGDSNG